jgi:hypothetical protein
VESAAEPAADPDAGAHLAGGAAAARVAAARAAGLVALLRRLPGDGGGGTGASQREPPSGEAGACSEKDAGGLPRRPPQTAGLPRRLPASESDSDRDPDGPPCPGEAGTPCTVARAAAAVAGAQRLLRQLRR